MKRKPIVLISLLLILTATDALPAKDPVVAVKASKIITISAKPITDGIILIEEGKIKQIGRDIAIPEQATLIDASNKTVMPGLVCAGPVAVTKGDQNEQSSEITSAFRIAEAIDLDSKLMQHIRQNGVTTFHVAPGDRNLIGGIGTVLKPTAKSVGEMTLKKDSALWITLGSASTSGNRPPRSSPPQNFYYRRPTTRMAVAWMVRKSFFDAKQYAKTKQKPSDPDMDILTAALKGDIPVFMLASITTDIRMALDIAAEYDLNITLLQCSEGYKLASTLADSQIPVILGPDAFSRRSYYSNEEINWNNAGILSKAGVKVALASYSLNNQTDMLTLSTFALRHGLDRDQALRAITLTPAEILGVADRVGSLKAGKDADLLVLSGDPLAATTRIDRVLINGKTVYQAD